ncbi:hypothetical protein MAPG_05535 [Magnaporthiopsis poae ATCC 64411]|uniref:Uncharacterized protein n=1 Tax=Magnaporthiopsis poae (strain ATCC 64411 / 73-15) TaxID=644358 RepID=A0A0C4DZN0_MAGP6|nr:hypothetical protein MAPG_05535 [Magnaporthiopsis poae ATCC 64411]
MDQQPSQPAGGDHAHTLHGDSEDEEEKKVNAEADKIIKEELHSDDYRAINEELELDSRAERLLIHLWYLMALLKRDRSMMWEQDYRIRDLEEEVKRLKAALRDSIPLADRVDPPLKPRTALERFYERRVKVAERRVADLLPENWELQWRCRDLQEQVKRLGMQLRDSVSFGDVDRPPWKPKTALERSLEKKILELEGKIHNPKGRGRSSTI